MITAESQVAKESKTIVTKSFEYSKKVMDFSSLKLYIAILDEFPDHMAPTIVAHAILGAHNEFKGYPLYDAWYKHSFKKVVLRVNAKEFKKILMSTELDVFSCYENTCLNAKDACAIINPKLEYPNVIKFAKLWQPKQNIAS